MADERQLHPDGQLGRPEHQLGCCRAPFLRLEPACLLQAIQTARQCAHLHQQLCQSAQAAAPRAPQRVSPVKAAIANDDAPALRLDLRGMRADQAQAEVERFLDKALLSGFSEVEIVHGRGTGALRRQIHDFLRSFPAVARFATAPEDRGGDGMTIVNLR